MCVCVCVCVCCAWSCLAPNATGCSPPGFFVRGISQARILEWVAISFSSGLFWPRDWTCVSCIEGGFFIPEPLGKTDLWLLLLYLPNYSWPSKSKWQISFCLTSKYKSWSRRWIFSRVWLSPSLSTGYFFKLKYHRFKMFC